MHVGQQIKKVLQEKRLSVSWFASQICCTRTHAYKILAMESINTDQLSRICRILDHNFFEDLSSDYESHSQKAIS